MAANAPSAKPATARPPKSVADHLEAARRALAKAEKAAPENARNSIARVRIDTSAILLNLERAAVSASNGAGE